MAVAQAQNVDMSAALQKQIDIFNKNTSFHSINLDTMTPSGASGGITSQTIRRVGLLQGIWLPINITVGGTVNTANAGGIGAAIKRVKVTVNSSANIFDVSGLGYGNLVNEQIGSEKSVAVASTLNQFASAVSATSFKLFMYIPVAMNRRDVTGLVLLQSEEQTVELSIDWMDQVTLGGTTATYTASVKPQLDVLSIPIINGKPFLPPLFYLHQILEQSDTISGAGDLTINPIRGNIYLSVFHGTTLAQSQSELGSRLVVQRNGYDTVLDDSVDIQDLKYSVNRGRARKAGVWAVDYMATTDQGMLGQHRDLFNSKAFTDYRHTLTVTGAATVTTVRRMLYPSPQA